MKTSNPRISEITKDKLSSDSGRNHLVVYQIWRQPAKGQVAFLLANYLVGCRETNKGGEPFDGDS
jgi:hypothetical protein